MGETSGDAATGVVPLPASLWTLDGATPESGGYVFVDPHPRGCSVTGGFVYRGCRLSSLRGEYLYSDLCARFLRTLSGVTGGVAQGQRDRTAELRPSSPALGAVTTFGEDARGELFVGDADGQVFAIVAED